MKRRSPEGAKARPPARPPSLPTSQPPNLPTSTTNNKKNKQLSLLLFILQLKTLTLTLNQTPTRSLFPFHSPINLIPFPFKIHSNLSIPTFLRIRAHSLKLIFGLALKIQVKCLLSPSIESRSFFSPPTLSLLYSKPGTDYGYDWVV